MKLVAALFFTAAASNLPQVREAVDPNGVPPLYSMISDCVDNVAYAKDQDEFWDANCIEYCWYYAHTPEACGETEPIEDYNKLVDCIVKRHKLVCRDTRGEEKPQVTLPPTTTLMSPEEERKLWRAYCEEQIYAPDTEDWDAFCKSLCEHYSGNGWWRCEHSTSAKEFTQCVVDLHPPCLYWNDVDPTAEDLCIESIYKDHGTGCIHLCAECEGTAAERIACVTNRKSECKTLYITPVIPSEKYWFSRSH